MLELFLKLEQPALVDLELNWPGGATAELAASMPGDVYAGDPLVILARLSTRPKGILTLAGRSLGHAWVRQLPITFVAEQAGIAKLWAREHIGELSRQRSFGAEAPQMEARITELALQHHLVSEFTSLVAVDDTPARPADMADRSDQAPTAAPVGGYWSNTTAFARTATPAPLLLFTGFVILAFAGVLYRLSVPYRLPRA